MEIPTFRDSCIAQQIRRKGRYERTAEEHQWVSSIDCKLNPFLYNQSFKPLSEYDLGLPQNDIIRLLSLPTTLQLAFGHINTLQEFRAYLLLSKFYIVENKCDFQKKSLVSIEIGLLTIDVNSVGRSLASLNDVQRLFQDWVAMTNQNGSKCKKPRSSPKSESREEIVISDLEDLKDVCIQTKVHAKIFLAVRDLVSLTNVLSFRAESFKTYCHNFCIENSMLTKKLGTLTISIVFQGAFVGNEYAPGKISGYLIKASDNTGNKHIGTCLPSLQVLNTTNNLGRLVIEYEPETAIDDGNYKLFISTFSECTYNISISGKMMYETEAYLVNELHSFVIQRNRARDLASTLHIIMLDVRIFEKKVSLITELCIQTEHSEGMAKRKLEAEEFQLDHDDSVHYDSQIYSLKELEQNLILHSNSLLDRQTLKNEVIDKVRFLNEEKQRITNERLEVAAKNNKIKMVLPSFFNLIGQYRLECIAKNIVENDENAVSSRQTNQPFCGESAHYSYIRQARSTLNEIDRVQMEKKPLVASTMLHSLPQLFPKDVLIHELERLFDSLTRKEIMKEEEATSSRRKLFWDSKICMNDDGSSTDTLDSADDDEESGAENITSSKVGTQPQNEKLCIACKSICVWASIINYENELKRREELTCLIIQTKRKHRYSASLSKVSIELLRQASLEAQTIDDKCKLYRVDMELHSIIQKKTQKYIITRALHNYDCMMFTTDAIYTLEKEHDRLIAKITAAEIIDDILAWMEKGWYFRSSTEVSEPIVVNSHVSWPAGPTQEHTIQTIHRASRRDRDSKKALARRIQNEDALNRSEKTIKMSLLCLTFRYFATVNSVKKQKINLLDERNITNESHERLKMKKEEERAKERDKLCMIWNGRATQGSHRIAKRKLHELSTKTKKLNAVQMHLTRKNASSLLIQKYYRGRVGRKAAARWKYELDSIRVWDALCHASAIAISKYWRGHSARKLYDLAKASITAYLLRIRKAEVETDEKEYMELKRFQKRRLNQNLFSV